MSEHLDSATRAGLLRILQDPTSTDREKVRAAKVVLASFEPEFVAVRGEPRDQAEFDLDAAAQAHVEGGAERESDLPEPTLSVADEAKALFKRPS